ncbi:MAG: type II toxin-antitoxin system RelE/ParE family toxin [Nitrospirales bacterium]|nr:MAG: type II toxin-antitoxin system RelE/ParE family toxin [Nitrospirales bacterium]
MKKIYKIIWAESAEKDLCRILEYVARDNPTHAVKIFNTIKRKTSNLYHAPTQGRIIPELKEEGILQYRELVIPPWRVMYRIAGQSVLVLAVLDSRRNIEDILLGKLLNLEG